MLQDCIAYGHCILKGRMIAWELFDTGVYTIQRVFVALFIEFAISQFND